PLPALVAERGLPVVLGGRPAHMLNGARPGGGTPRTPGGGRTLPQQVSYVDVDNAGGAESAVAHLIGTGRRRVATIAGPQDMGVGVARLAGYRAARDAAGLPADERLVAYGDFSEASGSTGMRDLLAARPDLDAVFAASDLMAVGALRVLREAGRRVPEDVAVLGFEDSPIAGQTDPPLTTVHQPVEEM